MTLSRLILGTAGRWIPSGRLTRAVAVLAGGSAVAQFIAILASPVSTRLYAPSDFGVMAVFNSLLGFLVIACTLRYDVAVPLPDDDEGALVVLALCLGVLGSMALLLLGVVCAGREWIAGMLRSEALAPWLWLLPVGVLGAGTYQAMTYWTVRRKRYKELSRTRLSQGVLGTSTMLALGALHGGPLGLIVGLIVSQTAGILLLQRDAAAVARGRDSRLTLARLRDAAWEYRQFPMFGAGGALLNSAGLLLPALLLTPFYGEDVTGWFALARNVMALPVTLVGTAVTHVFLGEAATLSREKPEDLPNLFRRATRRMLPVAAVIVAGGVLCPFVFPVLFGRNWGPAGVYAACLSLFCAAQMIVSPLSTIVVLRRRLGVQFVFDAMRVTLVVAALYVPYRLGWPALIAIALYSAAMAGMYVLYYVAYRRISLSPFERPEPESPPTPSDFAEEVEVDISDLPVE